MHEKDSKSMVLLRSGTLAASETRRTPAEATLDGTDLQPCVRKRAEGLCLWSAKVVLFECEALLLNGRTLRPADMPCLYGHLAGCNEDDQNNGGTMAEIRGVRASR
ncbi:uncharacterized protein SCHCODRAFT_02510436 [Schizophyllum commune H4-8]|uniref:Expressed protein n=1 Tax=Schizophyllum commune (strain H4-8 / FGSC 9210) TaxID=578458 RepID=D8QBQ7_SCHCM|nr:uncharacterized protein SCHCODRAFT_02510436 [Schizophyllum commune H4-8]KAI5889274.1 hypothetical protein SCHCODRAFT_02510436 [Schizophyllum commune H4-8]